MRQKLLHHSACDVIIFFFSLAISSAFIIISRDIRYVSVCVYVRFRSRVSTASEYIESKEPNNPYTTIIIDSKGIHRGLKKRSMV